MLIELKELSLRTGYDTSLILKWKRKGVLLPPVKPPEYQKGKRGKKSFYPMENLDRLKVINWYERTFEKSPGDALGIEGLIHLMFLFGFKSEEIYQTEITLIGKSSALYLKEYEKKGDEFLFDVLNSFEDYKGENLEFLESIFIQIFKRQLLFLKLKVLFAAMIRKLVIYLLPYLYNVQKYIQSTSRLNIKGLKKIQDGLSRIFVILPVQIGNPDYFKREETLVKDIFEHLTDKEKIMASKVIDLISKFTKTPNFISFLETVFNPKNAAMFPLIFLFLRDSEYLVEDFHLTDDDFTKEEMELINKNDTLTDKNVSEIES